MAKLSKEDLFREIGEIDEAYVDEAHRIKRTRRVMPWVTKTMVAAASLALCVGVGYGTMRLMSGGSDASSGSTANQGADGVWEESIREESAGTADEAVAYGAEETEETALSIRQQEEELAAARAEEETGAQKQETWGAAAESIVTDDSSDMIVEKEKESVSGGADGAADLTWEAARTHALYGKYVDVEVPEGYVYTSGLSSAAGLHVIWHKGMEEISISCRQADESVSDWLADPDCPEEYDLSLYPIPWSDSVPQELYIQVMNATFLSSQITPEIVAARTYQVEETGDVTGYRTRIGILYSNNVLVEITAKGPSAEEIYALINLEN